MQEVMILTESADIEIRPEDVEESDSGKTKLVFHTLVAKADVPTYNNTIYPASELRNAAKGLTGKTVFKNHNKPVSVDNIIGKVRRAYYDEERKGMYAICEINRKIEPLASNIEMGYATDVSLGGSCKYLTCNICGDKLRGSSCPNDHIAGMVYESKKAAGIINGLTFELTPRGVKGELSLVAQGAAKNGIFYTTKESVRQMPENKKLEEEIALLKKKLTNMAEDSQERDVREAKLEMQLDQFSKIEEKRIEEGRLSKFTILKNICDKLGYKAEKYKDWTEEQLDSLIVDFSQHLPKDVAESRSIPTTPNMSGTDAPIKTEVKDGLAVEEQILDNMMLEVFQRDRSKVSVKNKEHARRIRGIPTRVLNKGTE